MDISLQLYSLACAGVCGVEKEIEIAALHGYNGVEFAGFDNFSGTELKALLDKYKLYSKSSHTNFFGMNDDEFKRTLELHCQFGGEYIIMPYATVNCEDDAKRAAEVLNIASAKALQYGIKVGYHNHNHEFGKADNGKYFLDIMRENTTDDVVFELDTFWVSKGGEDPVEFIKKFGKRVELLHLKQCNAQGANVDIEDGVIDMKAVKATAKYTKYFIVEQENTGDCIKSSKHNADYLKTI